VDVVLEAGSVIAVLQSAELAYLALPGVHTLPGVAWAGMGAREARGRLGYPEVPIGRGPGREPLWPAEVVGSITHCDGYRAAMVAPVGVFAGVGLDAEPNAPLDESVIPSIRSGAEVQPVADLYRADPAVAWDRLLRSAKESVYKV
jgi:4'-phosphopantetheinyl transferase EntD